METMPIEANASKPVASKQGWAVSFDHVHVSFDVLVVVRDTNAKYSLWVETVTGVRLEDGRRGLELSGSEVLIVHTKRQNGESRACVQFHWNRRSIERWMHPDRIIPRFLRVALISSHIVQCVLVIFFNGVRGLRAP